MASGMNLNPGCPKSVGALNCVQDVSRHLDINATKLYVHILQNWKAKEFMMPLSVQEIENEIFSLDLQSRAQLAEKLILSIDAPSENENLQLWLAEAEQRYADLKAGKVAEFPAYEVIQSIRASLK